MSEEGTEDKWDVFLSYASEDRLEVAEPLAEALASFGVKVWYDRIELQIGDSLRRKIDEGLNLCRYGVVILSPAFFSKHYPKIELDGLAQREINGSKVILPVWHRVTDVQVRSFSPPLADRIAALSEEGARSIAYKILRVVHPDLVEAAENFAKSLSPLPELQSGLELKLILSGALGFHFGNDEPQSEAEMEVIAYFQQYLQDWLDTVPDLDVGDRVRAEYELSGKVRDLQAAGWTIFGRQEKKKSFFIAKPEEEVPVALVVLAQKGAAQVVQVGDHFIVSRPPAGPNTT
jgi:TIR domain